MNIMRKLRAGSLPGNQADAACSTQHLGLMHLKKLFTEYLHQAMSDRERDDKLYNMLPLFCKVSVVFYFVANLFFIIFKYLGLSI